MIIKTQIPSLTSGIGRGLAIGIGAAVSGIAAIKTLQTFKNLGIDDPLSYYKTDLSNMFTNISSLMYNTVRYYFGNFYSVQPAAVIAGIPLGSLQEVSHAVSDRVLKYRATGGIFLAHQEGGDQTLRLVGKAWGINRYIFLTLLDFLFLYGSPQIVDLFTAGLQYTINKNGVPLFPTDKPLDWSPTMTPQVARWQRFDLYSVDEGREEKHLTFPVITKSRIYTNMYIETYEFTESIENGLDCLTYSIFFRKYRPAFPYKYTSKQNEQGVPTFWYSVDEGDKNIKLLRQMDSMIELGFSASMIIYRMFQYLSGNSPETNVAHITGINLNNQIFGEEHIGKQYQEILPDLDYDLGTLSTQQRAELMALD